MSVDIVWNAGRTRASLTFAHTPGNLITLEMVQACRRALKGHAGEPHLKLLTIEGAGADFSFGASVAEHLPDPIQRVLPETHELILDLMQVPSPTAAIVRGRCVGGGFELALACDFIFAAESATFSLPEVGLGVFPPAACVLLPKRTGAARATSAVLTGEPRPADYWQAAGLIEELHPADALASAVAAWFDRTLAPKSAEALRHAVRAVRYPIAAAIAKELPGVERLYLDDLMRSVDALEGVRAFLEKRPPRWENR